MKEKSREAFRVGGTILPRLGIPIGSGEILVVKKRRRALTQAYASAWSHVSSSITGWVRYTLRDLLRRWAVNVAQAPNTGLRCDLVDIPGGAGLPREPFQDRAERLR